MYDPRTGKWTLVDTCFTTHHLYFANDASDNYPGTSAGPRLEPAWWAG
jgi:hypothetical protein